MKKISFLLLLLFILFLGGCTGLSDKDSGFSAPDASSEESDETEPNEGKSIPAGQITASVYFDNDNYSFWQQLLSSDQEGDKIFHQYTTFAFKTNNRIKLTIEGVPRAKVSLLENDKSIYTTYTNHQGIAYLFNDQEKENYNVLIEYQLPDGSNYSQTHTIENDEVLTLELAREINNSLQIMFIIDTTGSMGDEISYLKAEIDDVINNVQTENPNTNISLALMFYRDNGDNYVTKYFDFTSDINQQKNNLSKQNADGGGDFEEAVATAFNEAAQKQWSTGNNTKLIVHVADAPSHDNEIDLWNQSILKLSALGINIITVAASGINKKTEYFFRSQSLLTNGAYVYITNDSGIGEEHIEPTIPEKQVVEYLNALLIRLINGYHTGLFKEPVPYYQSQQ